jgi:hypothetical protein
MRHSHAIQFREKGVLKIILRRDIPSATAVWGKV